MANIKYPKVDLTIVDEQDKFEEDKDVKVSLRYNTEKGGFTATTPITKKRDTSPNLPIFDSARISLTVRIHKDSRLGPSGKISAKMVKELGDEGVHEEFQKAADAICNHFK